MVVIGAEQSVKRPPFMNSRSVADTTHTRNAGHVHTAVSRDTAGETHYPDLVCATPPLVCGAGAAQGARHQTQVDEVPLLF